MYKYVISLLFVLTAFTSWSQLTPEVEKEKDSIVHKTAYGLRLGIDISKPVLEFFDDDYSGLEFVADYRISKSWYIAAEFGTEQERVREDYITAFSEGNYLRVGANYNAYDNWQNMNNEIFVGFRYGISSFDQTLESYTINSGSPEFIGDPIIVNRKDSGLSAQWLELMLGIKVETFTNFFISVSGSYKIMVSIDDPNNFQSLFAPGFNRIFASNTGFGFNYTLSYLIPFKKK